VLPERENETGLDHYQVRGYTPWYRNITPSMAAIVSLTILHRGMEKDCTTGLEPGCPTGFTTEGRYRSQILSLSARYSNCSTELSIRSVIRPHASGVGRYGGASIRRERDVTSLAGIKLSLQ
jgi:hypothetical protein